MDTDVDPYSRLPSVNERMLVFSTHDVPLYRSVLFVVVPVGNGAVEAIVMLPAPLVILIPEPAVMVDATGAAPVDPTNICPLVSAGASATEPELEIKRRLEFRVDIVVGTVAHEVTPPPVLRSAVPGAGAVAGSVIEYDVMPVGG
jgi:hypothetical protein